MSSSDSSPTPKESQSPASQNPVEGIPNPQNVDEEMTSPQNPNQEIPIPQKPDQEITNPEDQLLLTPREVDAHEAQTRRQQEVEGALRQLYGEKGDEWAKEYRMGVAEIQMDAMYGYDWTKDDKNGECILFDDDWEVAKDCILFKGSRNEVVDDIKTMVHFVDYVKNGYPFQENANDFEFLYGVVSSYGWDCAGLEVLKKKLAKLLSKYLMFAERKWLYPRMVWNLCIDIFVKLGEQVWGKMFEGTFPLLDKPGIGIRNRENFTIVDMRDSSRRHQGRQYRISQDPTIGKCNIRTDPTSVNEAFVSQPAFNLNRGLEIRQAGKLADDQPPEAVADVKGKGKQQAERGDPNQRPRKFQSVEEVLLLFQRAKTEEEDDFILLRYASAYGRNVTSPTVAGLYKFILANLRTGESISWFLLKLKLTMLERRYLSLLRMLNPNGNVQYYNTEYDREMHRLGRQFWGDEISDQNPDGNMGTRVARRGASGGGGAS